MDREDLRHAIAAVVDEGLVGPELTVEDLVPHVAANPRSIGWALRRLGFKQVRGKTRGRRRADGTRARYAAQFRAPTPWPEWFEVERAGRGVDVGAALTRTVESLRRKRAEVEALIGPR